MGCYITKHCYNLFKVRTLHWKQYNRVKIVTRSPQLPIIRPVNHLPKCPAVWPSARCARGLWGLGDHVSQGSASSKRVGLCTYWPKTKDPQTLLRNRFQNIQHHYQDYQRPFLGIYIFLFKTLPYSFSHFFQSHTHTHPTHAHMHTLLSSLEHSIQLPNYYQSHLLAWLVFKEENPIPLRQVYRKDR